MERAWVERDNGSNLEIQGLISLVLHKILKAYRTGVLEDAESGRLARIKKHVNKRLAHPLKVSELACLIGLNPGYFGAWFRAQTGQTVLEYINRQRIQHAELLLNTGEFSISETAEKCGFSDVFYFSKVFRKYTGQAPSELIKKRKAHGVL